MEAGNESRAFPRAACLSQGAGAAVCGAAAARGEGAAPPPGTYLPAETLPARSAACRELPGAVTALAGEGICSWASGVEPQSLRPYEDDCCCVRGCGAPRPQWLPTMLRLNFPKVDPWVGGSGDHSGRIMPRVALL